MSLISFMICEGSEGLSQELANCIGGSPNPHRMVNSINETPQFRDTQDAKFLNAYLGTEPEIRNKEKSASAAITLCIGLY